MKADGDDAAVITILSLQRPDFLVWIATLGESFWSLDPLELVTAGQRLVERVAEATPT